MTLADHAGPEHDYVLRATRAGYPTRWSPPKGPPRDTPSDWSLPTRTEARADSIRPCRTNQPGNRSCRVASASPPTPAAETTVALFEARLHSSQPTEADLASRSQRSSFSYGSARPLPRAQPAQPPSRDRTPPEGAVPRDRRASEQARPPSGHRFEPDATLSKAEAPESVFRRNETPAGTAPPRTRKCVTRAATPRPKPVSYLLSALSPPQAATPADRQPGLRSRSHMRAHRYVRAGTSEDAHLSPVTRTPRGRDWLTPGNRRRLPEVRCLSAK